MAKDQARARAEAWRTINALDPEPYRAVRAQLHVMRFAFADAVDAREYRQSLAWRHGDGWLGQHLRRLGVVDPAPIVAAFVVLATACEVTR